MKVIALLIFIFYVDCLPHNATIRKPFYVSRRYLGEDVVFRVVSGIPAKLGDVPYQVALMKWKDVRGWETFCGGTVISRSRVLSAAHCVSDKISFCGPGKLKRYHLKGLYAVAGNLATVERRAFSDGQGHGQWRRLTGGIFPKTYKFPKDDIALLHTADPFVFNKYVKAVPLAKTDIDYGGKICTISGYGRQSHTATSPVLLFGKVKVLFKNICDSVHGKDMRRFVCINDLDADAHKGDSGGPLVCTETGDEQENSIGLLVGAVSGKTFGLPQSTFFTRVSSYRKFIESKCSNELHKLPLYLLVTILQLLLQFPGFFLKHLFKYPVTQKVLRKIIFMYEDLAV